MKTPGIASLTIQFYRKMLQKNFRRDAFEYNVQGKNDDDYLHNGVRPLFRRYGFLLILIALWLLPFFKHGYDGYHESSFVNSCAIGTDIGRLKQGILVLVRETTIAKLSVLHVGKLLLFENQLYHSRSVSGLHLIRLFIILLFIYLLNVKIVVELLRETIESRVLIQLYL